MHREDWQKLEDELHVQQEVEEVRPRSKRAD